MPGMTDEPKPRLHNLAPIAQPGMARCRTCGKVAHMCGDPSHDQYPLWLETCPGPPPPPTDELFSVDMTNEAILVHFGVERIPHGLYTQEELRAFLIFAFARSDQAMRRGVGIRLRPEQLAVIAESIVGPKADA